LPFLGVDATEPAPFANGKLGLAQKLGDFGGGVIFLDHVTLEQPVEGMLDPAQAVQ